MKFLMKCLLKKTVLILSVLLLLIIFFKKLPLLPYELDIPVRKKITTIISSSLETHFQNLKSKQCIFAENEPSNVRWNNLYWQKVKGAEIFLFSAYYDDRYSFSKGNFLYIRVIAIVEGLLNDSFPLYCYLWYKKIYSEVMSVKAEFKEIWIKPWSPNRGSVKYNAYLLSCPAPLQLQKESSYIYAVSISKEECDTPSTFIKLKKHLVKRKLQFALCVKGLNFDDDISDRLIEWIEINMLLGADIIFFYIFSVPQQMAKVLKYYSDQGKVQMINLSLAGSQPNDPQNRTKYLKKNIWQKRRNEMIPFNDCLYRNIYDYTYIIPIDVDEILLPVKHYKWEEMLKEFLLSDPTVLTKHASLSVQNVYFLSSFNNNTNKADSEDIPHYFYTLRNRMRSANFSLPGYSVKSFVQTNSTLLVFNHYTIETLYLKTQQNILLNTSLAQMNHYKNKCPREIYSQCKDKFLKYKMQDDIILRFKAHLVERVKQMRKELKMFY